MAFLEGGVYEFDSSEYIDYVCGALDQPQSHLRNGCTCWSRRSMEALANCICQALIRNRKKALRRSWQALRGVSVRLTIVSSLILLEGALVRPQSHLMNGCTCCSRCILEALANCRRQALVRNRKGTLGKSWQACRVAFTSSTLVSKLILLAGALVSPWIHLRNGCTCWSRCSTVAFSNSRCQTLVAVLRSSSHNWTVTSAR